MLIGVTWDRLSHAKVNQNSDAGESEENTEGGIDSGKVIFMGALIGLKQDKLLTIVQLL
jgi:hypothetical protein